LISRFSYGDRKPGDGVERYGSSLAAWSPQEPVICFKTPRGPAAPAHTNADAALNRTGCSLDTGELRFD
jgi:ParB family chromosome partitioning protein